MNRNEHKAFAVSIGVPIDIYDKMNADHEARNAAIRQARAVYFAAIGTAEQEESGKRLDAILANK